MTREQSITFKSGDLTLDGRLALPERATYAVAVCHPHPQYGGDMHNNVVVAITARLHRAGVGTLRFNFRGVGASEGRYDDGRGETDDARAAVGFLRQRSGAAAVTLAGYSFGAVMALRAGCDDPGVDGLVAVAPPVAMVDLTFLAACTTPKLFVVGDRDPFCAHTVLADLSSGFAGENRCERIAGADHFFTGFEEQVADAVMTFLDRRGRAMHQPPH